jgi:hypothetical protein
VDTAQLLVDVVGRVVAIAEIEALAAPNLGQALRVSHRVRAPPE